MEARRLYRETYESLRDAPVDYASTAAIRDHYMHVRAFVSRGPDRHYVAPGFPDFIYTPLEKWTVRDTMHGSLRLALEGHPAFVTYAERVEGDAVAAREEAATVAAERDRVEAARQVSRETSLETARQTLKRKRADGAERSPKRTCAR